VRRSLSGRSSVISATCTRLLVTLRLRRDIYVASGVAQLRATAWTHPT
jgi:hypothetical protein